MSDRVARAAAHITPTTGNLARKPSNVPLTEIHWFEAVDHARLTSDPYDLSELCKHPHWIVRNEAAGRSLTPADMREWLADNDETLSVRATAKNSLKGVYETDAGALRLEHERWIAQSMKTGKTGIVTDSWEEDQALASSTNDHETLRTLATHPFWQVRQTTAANKSTPSDALLVLHSDYHPNVRTAVQATHGNVYLKNLKPTSR